MSLKSELFFPGWWKYLLFGIVCGIVFHLLCGCSSPAVSEPKYPEYEKWWTLRKPKRSHDLGELSQGDILVFGNGQEAMLL